MPSIASVFVPPMPTYPLYARGMARPAASHRIGPACAGVARVSYVDATLWFEVRWAIVAIGVNRCEQVGRSVVSPHGVRGPPCAGGSRHIGRREKIRGVGRWSEWID